MPFLVLSRRDLVHRGELLCVIFLMLMQHSQAGIWVWGLLDLFPCGAVQMYWLLIFQTIAIAWVLGGGKWVQRDKK